MASNITSYGKIRYIEPNRILQDKIYPEDNGSYNIPHNQEDYSIAVDILVEVPKRCGYAETKGGTYRFSLKEKSEQISFLGGSKRLLTDTPGSITYYDVVNQDFEGTQESLGITNIHITYNSYFYPEVTINFTDVRGAALMMPHEENYRREQINKNGGIEFYDTKVENFFAALFSFPYPDFKLQVKGFYGKMIEYNLVVSDFRSSFNSQTGNFDATVKFIGKMYGFYTDIPMAYLLMAPYCKYGGTNNQTRWEMNSFKLDNNTPMPTFLELRKRVMTAHAELATNMNYESVQRYTAANRRLDAIRGIKEAYNRFISYLDTKYTSQPIILSDTFREDLFLFEREDFGTYCDYLYTGSDSETQTYTQNLHDLITRYNESDFAGTSLPYLGDLDTRQKKLGDGTYCPHIKFRKLSTGIVIIDMSVSDGGLLQNNPLNSLRGNTLRLSALNGAASAGFYPETVVGVTNYFVNKPEGSEAFFYALCGRKLANAITTIESETQQEIFELKRTIDESYGQRMESLLGFLPSVRNIFKILMAHLQTFVEIFSTCITNIVDVNCRKISDHGLSFRSTDIPDRGSNLKDVDLPPFPAIIDTNNTYCYPTSIATGVMEETKLIDAIFDGTFTFLENNALADEEINSLNDRTLEFIPTCLTDLLLPNNPYSGVFDLNNNTIYVDWIMAYFGIRCMSRFNIEQNTTTLSYEEFGKSEAYNFWRQNKTLRREVVEMIESGDFNDINFIGFLCGDSGNTYINGKPCYSLDVNSEKLLKREGSDLIPTGDYNVPAVLRNKPAIETYWTDMDNTRVPEYALKGNTKIKNRVVTTDNTLVTQVNVPYHYINFTNAQFLTDWNSKISSTDLSAYLTDDSKRNLVERFIKPTEGLFETGYVRYRTEEPEAFFNKFDTAMPTGSGVPYYCTFKYLSDYYDNEFDAGFVLDDISNSDDVPMFFVDNLTPEKLLCNIPHNITKINNLLEAGRNCITIPYATKLFIGLCLKYGQNNDMDTLFDMLSQTPLRGNDGAISTMIRYFLLHEDGSMATDTYNNPITSLKLDYLGLITEYNQWANSTNPGGYKYFVNQYKLHNIRYSENNVTISGSTPYESLKMIGKLFSSSDGTVFNKVFVNDTSQIGRNTNLTDFTNRYSAYTYVTRSERVSLSFNKEFEAYQHLMEFFKKNSKLVLPYNIHETSVSAPASGYQSAFKAFKEALLRLYTNTNPETGEATNTDYSRYSSRMVTEESKLSMYLTLKNIYDKHYTNFDIDKFKLDSSERDSEFDRFHFVDTFYNDIGDELIMNATNINQIIESVTNGYESGTGEGIVQSEMSVYSFMSSLCEKNNMMLMALPVFNGSFTGDEGAQNLEDMFRPIPYDEIVDKYPMKGPSYVCFYPHQPSKHLNIPNSAYKNDGFSLSSKMDDDTQIDDINNTADFLGPLTIDDLKETDDNRKYIIPAFAVEYGVQNQGIFKNVNVNMDNPQVTEYSVAAQFNIAQGQNTAVRKLSYEGQDLFKVYSNHSYTCQVEMMGCAQIQPLMYFQLNNIPMFRGAYQIINVEHNITPGNMITSFKGVRINRNKIPMVKTCINFSNMMDNMSGQTSFDAQRNDSAIPEYNGSLIDGGNEGNGLDAVPSDVNITYDKCVNDLGSAFRMTNIDRHPSKEEAFNDSNPHIRRLVYSIAKLMQDNQKGIEVTSMTRRYDSPSTSDHSIAVEANGGSTNYSYNNKDYLFLGAQRRTDIEGTDANGVTKSYALLGCAVDMHGTMSNGAVDKTNASIPLFHAIATQYTENIRQLIWEITERQAHSVNSISNCVHLASYGERGEHGNDKTEIYVGIGPNAISIVANNASDISKAPTNLPPMFIKVLYDMATLDKLSGVTLLNFENAGINSSRITKSILQSWCEELGVL